MAHYRRIDKHTRRIRRAGAELAHRPAGIRSFPRYDRREVVRWPALTTTTDGDLELLATLGLSAAGVDGMRAAAHLGREVHPLFFEFTAPRRRRRARASGRASG